MLITQGNLDTIFTGFQAAFNKGAIEAPAVYRDIAMITPSQTEKELYAWLGQFPGMRKWVGDRVVKGLSTHSFTIINGDYEDTIRIQRNKIEDDQYGVFAPFFTDMGRAAMTKPDELVLSLLSEGFASECYDGQYFFDTDHPVTSADGTTVLVSNMQAGASTPWYLLDASRAVRPLIWQERLPFNTLERMDEASNERVFLRNEFLYGTRGRGNAGYGLWQLAFASKAALTSDNYEAARAAMMAVKGDEGRPLGIKPTHLVVPPSLEGAAMRILNNGSRTITVDDGSGGTNAVAIANEWANSAKIVVSPWLA